MKIPAMRLALLAAIEPGTHFWTREIFSQMDSGLINGALALGGRSLRTRRGDLRWLCAARFVSRPPLEGVLRWPWGKSVRLRR